jgi:hypothetical protein
MGPYMKRSRFDDALLWATALLTATVAAAGLVPEASAAHDAATVRAVGLGFTGPFHPLDLLASAPAMLVPIGPRVLRAALASTLLSGAAAAVWFEAARGFVGATLPAGYERSKLASSVAALSVLTATLSPAWQAEATAPGGAVLGALLVGLALVLGQRVQNARIGPLAFVCALAATDSPFTLIASLLAAAPWLAARLRSPIDRADRIDAALGAFVGLAPFAISAALLRRPPELALFAEPVPPGTSFVAFAQTELGTLIVVAAGAGLALAALRSPWLAPRLGLGRAFRDASGLKESTELSPAAPAGASADGSGLKVNTEVSRNARARDGARADAGAIALALVVAGGALAAMRGEPATSTHASAAVLAAIAAVLLFTGAALGNAVVAIARARVPFAQASAALVVVLELVLPVRAADETMGRREARAPRASSTWSEMAWGGAPPAAVVLVTDRGTMRRIAAARATGEFRTDLLVVPAFDLDARQAKRALASEPKLAPLYRDVALGAAPEELSLSELAVQRPVLAAFEPRWDRALARHLVPMGLLARFEPEPRGGSDRKKALEAFTPFKDRLVRVAAPKRDPDLANATATLLRARAIGMAACGERESLSHALDDLRPFSPDDKVAATLVRRMLTAKAGVIDVKDLSP